jgi:hypothetical protein
MDGTAGNPRGDGYFFKAYLVIPFLQKQTFSRQ